MPLLAKPTKIPLESCGAQPIEQHHMDPMPINGKLNQINLALKPVSDISDNGGPDLS
jgi:hypothetical protein